MILLPLSYKCWYYKHEPLNLGQYLALIDKERIPKLLKLKMKKGYYNR
jgi:hypothetical protein